METNSRLMKKFEESRAELEKVLQVAQEGLEEKGDPEELLHRHTVSASLSLCNRDQDLPLAFQNLLPNLKTENIVF